MLDALKLCFKSGCYLEGFSKIPIQRRIDDGIQQTIGVPQPQKQPRYSLQSLAIRIQEWPHQRQHEERKPADGERTHDDAQRCARFPLLRQLETELLLVRVGAGRGFHGCEEAGAGFAFCCALRGRFP